jgi:alpha-N-arabinofuranosidase
MKKHKKIVIWIAALIASIGAHADDCQQPGVQEISIEINTTKIIRADAPKEIFGFNIAWWSFQRGYFRTGSVRPELIEWLLPFAGAAYRYPGGSPSNWFEWRKSVGAVAQRAAQHSEFERYAVAEFGLMELSEFILAVKGRAVLTLNLVGPYKKSPLSPDELAIDTLEMMNYVLNKTKFGCVGGDKCGVMAWELGNELEWAPYNWPASTYIKRADAVVTTVSAVMPEAQWIANGRTAPWGAKSPDYRSYNTAIAAGLAGKVHAISIHPYYDGITIPTAAQYVTDFGKTWDHARAGGKVFVTEHARWPTQPTVGKWEYNWYQGTGVGGAISSVDFVLATLMNPLVASANWGGLAVEGPWQLVRLDKTKDLLYPSPVYWGLRTIREAYLDHVVHTRYKQPTDLAYAGYSVRILGMSSTDGKSASVIGVNRNAAPYKIRILWSGGTRKRGQGLLRTVSGASTSEDNTDAEPEKITMKTDSQILLSNRSTSVWCVPANAVFSIVEP